MERTERELGQHAQATTMRMTDLTYSQVQEPSHYSCTFLERGGPHSDRKQNILGVIQAGLNLHGHLFKAFNGHIGC